MLRSVYAKKREGGEGPVVIRKAMTISLLVT